MVAQLALMPEAVIPHARLPAALWAQHLLDNLVPPLSLPLTQLL